MTRDVRAKVRPGACAKCGSSLIEKKIAKRDPFWSCVRYGADTAPCTYSERSVAAPAAAAVAPAPAAAKAPPPSAPSPTASAAPVQWTREATGRPCPRCGIAKLDVLTPSDPSAGAPWYACADRECGFKLPVGARRRKDPCPQCGGIVLERRRANSAEWLWQCARHPECAYTAAPASAVG
jgi:ssDNA-binding Zn-finger/Zn-ribbon topoisomerase 1